MDHWKGSSSNKLPRSSIAALIALVFASACIAPDDGDRSFGVESSAVISGDAIPAQNSGVVELGAGTFMGGCSGTLMTNHFVLTKQIAVARNADGRLELFYVGTDDALYHNWQNTSGGGWRGEVPLGGFAKQIAVGANADGRLELFYVGTDDALYHNWQNTSGGGWNGEIALGGSAKRIAIERNGDGRLELFYVGTNDALYHNSQAPTGGWNGEASLGGFAKQISAAHNADGRLELFYAGTDDALYHNWQKTLGGEWNGEARL